MALRKGCQGSANSQEGNHPGSDCFDELKIICLYLLICQPISLLKSLSKVFEVAITLGLTEFLSCHGAFSYSPFVSRYMDKVQ